MGKNIKLCLKCNRIAYKKHYETIGDSSNVKVFYLCVICNHKWGESEKPPKKVTLTTAKEWRNMQRKLKAKNE